jgi:hypothetical protein
MKKLMVALLLVLVSSTALAQNPTIGIYEDDTYTICYGDIVPFVQKMIYVVAWLPPEIAGITAVEFKIDNLPPDDGGGIITPAWNSDLVIGDVNWDISIAWPGPQAGPYVLIGTLSFLVIVDGWIPMDHVMMVQEGNDCQCLVVVDDNFVEYPADGGMYTFNCTDPEQCGCFEDIPTEATNWGSVKALY